jgi:RNA recognition motif-containing protein
MTNIFVARLDYGVTQDELRSIFEEYGQVNKASLAMDKETGKSKGFAFIEMENDEEAQAAIKSLDGYTMHGREIAVKQAEDRQDNRPKREFTPGAGGERKPFSRPGDKPFSNDYKKVDPPVNFVPYPTENLKTEGRKKEAPAAKKKEPKPKTHKMEAYKKSGKQNRFTDFDDDDDF